MLLGKKILGFAFYGDSETSRTQFSLTGLAEDINYAPENNELLTLFYYSEEDKRDRIEVFNNRVQKFIWNPNDLTDLTVMDLTETELGQKLLSLSSPSVLDNAESTVQVTCNFPFSITYYTTVTSPYSEAASLAQALNNVLDEIIALEDELLNSSS
jgi:hypothetical protein